MKASTLSMIESGDAGILPPMTEIGQRIKHVREKANMTQTELARRLKVSRGAVGNWELGGGIDRTNIEQIATEFGVSIDWLLKGIQEVNASQKINMSGSTPIPFFDEQVTMPVYAGAEGGMGELIIHTDAIEYVPRPYTLAHVKDAFAIVVTGESMWPAFKPGDKAWVNPLLPPGRGDDCVLFSIDPVTGEERALIKEYVRSTNSEWIVQQHNPVEELRLDRTKWQHAYKVVGKFHR